MMSDWNVELIDDSVSDFEVIFKGPKESKPALCPPVLLMIHGDAIACVRLLK